MTTTNWYNNYVLPVLAEVRYEFAQAFLETHSYIVPQPIIEHPHKVRTTSQFTSPYGEWRDQYRGGHTAPADALLAKYAPTPCLILALHA